jgi:hypothetical protein
MVLVVSYFPSLYMTIELVINDIADYMGLEVHDMGAGGYLLSGIPPNAEPNEVKAAFHEMVNSPETTNPSILEENSVITVEPGM